jgi:hypothetical protein
VRKILRNFVEKKKVFFKENKKGVLHLEKPTVDMETQLLSIFFNTIKVTNKFKENSKKFPKIFITFQKKLNFAKKFATICSLYLKLKKFHSLFSRNQLPRNLLAFSRRVTGNFIKKDVLIHVLSGDLLPHVKMLWNTIIQVKLWTQNGIKSHHLVFIPQGNFRESFAKNNNFFLG